MKCKTGKINKNKIILWNKEVGETSFYSLGKIKKLLGTKKVGHTGTLDKFAHGLMIVLSGKLTRLNSLFSSMDKSYIADITFGKETDTLDPTGNVLYEAPVPEQETVINTLSGFMGLQHQIPPMYSAIHVDGKRAWKRALDGENIEMKPRTIRIDQLKVIHWIDNTLRIEIHCSKGTYIRSFARDLAISCNSRAHLTALQRISVGPFQLQQVEKQDELSLKLLDAWDLTTYLKDFFVLKVQKNQADLIIQGRELSVVFNENPFDKQGFYGLFDDNKELLAVVTKKLDVISYLFVVPKES